MLDIPAYQTAFAYYDPGDGSTMGVVFFVLILLISRLLFHDRQKSGMAMSRAMTRHQLNFSNS